MLCELSGTPNVYFQPPETIQMNYPAIVYGLDGIENSFANGGVYSSERKYAVLIIDKNPDSGLVPLLAALPLCRFNRHYKKDNLNHYLFTLYF